jgi:tetratricopeptide (TPR) repeat protein
MPYLQSYLTDLVTIITKIKNGQINGPGQAVLLFQNYVTQVKGIGHYNVNEWQEPLLKKIYEFAEAFKNVNPTEFIAAIDNEIAISSLSEIEILSVIKSEILWNFENPLNQLDWVLNLRRIYPANPEFLNTLGHLRGRQKRFEEGIECYSQALRITSRQDIIFAKFNIEIKFVEFLIENEKYEEASNIVDELVNNETYISSFVHHNWLVFLKNRIKDYSTQDKKAKKKELELRKYLNDEFQSERKKVIELLGLFTAIIAFIFTTVSISKTFEYNQAINFISCLGLVLINFAITISLIFHESKRTLLKDIRIYALLITLIATMLLVKNTVC